MPITQTIRRLVLIAAATVVAAGCAHKKPPPPPPPAMASSDQVQAIRNAYFRAYPDSRVGVVSAVLRHKNGTFAAVGEVEGRDFHEGEVVTFIDGKQKVLATGTVVRVLPDAVHVLVDRPTGSGREPRAGDLMVKLPFGATTL
jgi:hypothetical protein